MIFVFLFCRDVDGPRDCHPEWSQSEREKQISCPVLNSPECILCLFSRVRGHSALHQMSFLEKFQNLPAEVTRCRGKREGQCGGTGGHGGTQRLGERLHCSLAHACMCASPGEERFENVSGLGPGGTSSASFKDQAWWALPSICVWSSCLLSWSRRSKGKKVDNCRGKSGRTYSFMPWFGSALTELEPKKPANCPAQTIS